MNEDDEEEESGSAAALARPLRAFAAAETPRLLPTDWWPVDSWLLLLLGFAASVAWIDALASELVAVLGVLGNRFGAAPGLMGMTVLTWGNSTQGEVHRHLALVRT